MQKEIIFIGLGRMGNAMSARLVENGYTVNGYDVSEEAREAAEEHGVLTFNTIAETVNAMEGQKVVWMMVPAKFVDGVLEELHTHLKAEDIIIDGGNTFFEDTRRRAWEAGEKEIHYIDVGTSGGVEGARHGASLMIGGNAEIVQELRPLFGALATKNGFGHVGESGAGHYVKMVHNGIEYGMMGAIAEGLSFLENSSDTFKIDMDEVLKPYSHGSIIKSSLMDWMRDAYETPGYLENIAGEVPRGETESEMEYIIEQNQTPVLKASVEQRKSTRKEPNRVGTLISAMRNQFGGHQTVKKDS